MRIPKIIALIILCSCYFSAAAQKDSIVQKSDSLQLKKQSIVAIDEVKVKGDFKPNPKTAVRLGALIPGGGQIYNRKYWKLPIVYAGYAALIYSIMWNDGYYSYYKKGYISIADNDTTTNFYVKQIPVGMDLASLDEAWMKSVLNAKQEHYRRYRDLSILGTLGFYALTLVDAYVDAQLFDFDISPDLSMHVQPNFNYLSGQRNSSLGISCYLNF